MKQDKPAEAYPLQWPTGRNRSARQESDRFNASFTRARDELVSELRLLGATAVVLSTNIPLRRDGLPSAPSSQPDDTGVAVYFTYKKRQMCFACDRWKKIEGNMRAVTLTIGALRGISRWGTGDMMEAAFTGFTALPSPEAARSWRDVLGVDWRCNDIVAIDYAYKKLRSANHPDKGGDARLFDDIEQAYKRACDELIDD